MCHLNCSSMVSIYDIHDFVGFDMIEEEECIYGKCIYIDVANRFFQPFQNK